MSTTYLDELAVRFVERDSLTTGDQNQVAADAADFVQFPQKHRTTQDESTVLSLVKSIQRWVSLADDDQSVEKNREKHAKALKFLAMTLTALPKGFLQSKQIKLFTDFFGSIYRHHDSGLATATEAITVLVSMNNFQPSSADDILQSIGSIVHENFTKQLAKTRLHIFQVIKSLLLGSPSARVLQKRYEGSEFLLPILALSKRERDPTNLLDWFGALGNVLKQYKLSTEVACAAFESFSPFFPISIRKSPGSGPEVTEEELKEALRACFCANGELAQHAFPFLLEKLENGGSLNASAKLDILRTIKACLMSYEPIDTSVIPYNAKIWSSLKFEVKNGEVPEAIKETLSVFEAISERLALESSGDTLKTFVTTVWNDCVEDLESASYAEQAGSILVSVANGGMRSFCLVCPRLLEAVRRNITQPSSPAHAKHLLILLNNLLRTRMYLISKLDEWPSADKETLPGTDFDVSVTIVHDIYFKILRENTTDSPAKEQVDIAKEALKGLSLVTQQQQITEGWATTAAYGQDTLKQICTLLAHRVVNCFDIPHAPSRELQDIDMATMEALRTAVKFYPEGYRTILSDVVKKVANRDWASNPAERSFHALLVSCQRIAFLGTAEIPVNEPPLINFTAFAASMLKILSELFKQGANLRACASVVDGLASGMAQFVQTCDGKGLKKSSDSTTSWDLASIKAVIKKELPAFPSLVNPKAEPFDPTQLTESMRSGASNLNVFTSFLQLGVYIVSQLYQNSTRPVFGSDDLVNTLRYAPRVGLKEALVGESKESEVVWRGRFLEGVGLIATIVLRELSASAQKDLLLHDQIFGCFCMPPSWKNDGWDSHVDDQITVLSCGIAHAIRPEVVLELGSKLDVILLGGVDTISRTESDTQVMRDHVAFLLANKFDTSGNIKADKTDDIQYNAWYRVRRYIEDAFKSVDALSESGVKFCRFVAILAGALARQDRYIDVSRISYVAANGAQYQGRVTARVLEKLFMSPKALDPKNHTIRKPLHLQWTYQKCVHPIVQSAYPLRQPGPNMLREQTVVFAIYVLHAVKHLTVDHYREDLKSIFRIVLTAMKQTVDDYDLEAACVVVLHILVRETDCVREHASSVVDACVRAYRWSTNRRHLVRDPPQSRSASEGLLSSIDDEFLRSGRGPARITDARMPSPPAEDRLYDDPYSQPYGRSEPVESRFCNKGDLTKIRKICVRILHVLAKEFDTDHLKPETAKDAQQELRLALADPDREIRRQASVALRAWSE